MGLRNQSAIRHLSYQEVDLMLRAMVDKIRNTTKVVSLTPNNSNDNALVALLADMMNVPVNGSGTRISFYSEAGAQFCFFKLNYASELYNREVKDFIEEIEVNDDNTHQRVTLPWKK